MSTVTPLREHDPDELERIANLEWDEPEKLPVGLLPVEPFSYELLPESIRPWVEDICDRIQCPPDYVGVSSMTTLAATVGRKIAIRPQQHTDWTVIANLWALIIGRPGVLKSPALEASLAFLKRLAAIAIDEHEDAVKDYKQAKKVAKLRAMAMEKEAQKLLSKDPKADVGYLLKDDEEPEEPFLRRYLTNNTTAEALGELLRQNPMGLLVHRDEMVSLLKTLDREEYAESRGFFLTGANGDSGYTFDRIGRGLNLHVPAVCLSLLGSTQPGRIAHYLAQAVKGGAGDDGLIQRFGLLVWPDIEGEWKDVDRLPITDAAKNAYEAFKRLDRLDAATAEADQDLGYDNEPDGPPYLRFNPKGLALFQEWREGLERKLRSGELHPALEAHLSKYRKLVPALALITHLADGGTGPVDSIPTLKALAWSEYLESHAKRAYGSATAPEVEAAQAILYRVRREDLKDGFSGRDVYKSGWSKLTDREVVLDALRLLEDYNWLKSEQQKKETGGRPKAIYYINPGAKEAKS